MIGNENFITIQGFMVNELDLKGNELLVYAIIYGFSQDGESEFTGSRRYLAEWCNVSLPSIDKALKSLIEKDCIIKTEKIINNVIFNTYKINLQVVKKLYRGCKETLQGGCKETLHNNIDNNNIDNNIDSVSTTKNKEEKNSLSKKPTLDEIKAYCKEKNLQVNPVTFFNYFDTGNWIDSKGNKVKNWKQKLLTWNSFNNKQNNREINIETEEEKMQRKIKALEEAMKNGD